MAAKLFATSGPTTGTVYVIIKRLADDYYINDADGSFAASPADPYVSMTEDGTAKGTFELSEDRTTWDDGDYRISFYLQSGGSPVPSSDTILGGNDFPVADNAVITVKSNYDVLTNSTYGLESIYNLLSAINGSVGTRAFRELGLDIRDIEALVRRILSVILENNVQIRRSQGAKIQNANGLKQQF